MSLKAKFYGFSKGEKVIKIKEIYFYTFWLTLVGTRRKSSLKTKFSNWLNVHVPLLIDNAKKVIDFSAVQFFQRVYGFP